MHHSGTTLASLSKQGFRPPVAVVDWVKLRVALKRASEGGKLKGKLESDYGVSHADPESRGAGNAATVFTLTVQEPASHYDLAALVTFLDREYGLISIPEIVAIEVSIDWRHCNHAPDALSAMTLRLMRSALPPIIENPRLCEDVISSGLLVWSHRCVLNPEMSLVIGNKSDDLMWRTYWKRTNDMFIGEDSRRIPKALPFDKHSARAEVRIQGAALRELGLSQLSDLSSFKFETLNGKGRRYFRFARYNSKAGPLFPAPNPWFRAVVSHVGINEHAPVSVIERYGRKGSRGRIKKISRHLVIDEELTEAARIALRGLTNRFAK